MVKLLKMSAALSAILCLSSPLQQSNASGLPVVDAAHMTQTIMNQVMNYAQYLLDYAEQLSHLEQMVTAYKQQLIDSIAPMRDTYSSVKGMYDKLRQAYDGIMSIRMTYSNTLSYIQDNYGDSDFWIQCALSECNPFTRLEGAYKATTNELSAVLSRNKKVAEDAETLGEAIDDLEGQIANIGEAGIASNLQIIGQLQAQIGKAILLNQATMNQYQAAMSAERIAAENRREAETQAQEKFFTPATYDSESWSHKSIDFTLN